MLSYRHAFHAGNHADVLKHFVLHQILSYMNQKDKPYWIIDTHAGAGIYDLSRGYAAKNAEYANGIKRLWKDVALPEALQAYVDLLRPLNPDGVLQLYPGSPWIESQVAREADRLRLFELHPTDFKLLQENFRDAGRRVTVNQSNGFDALKALLPPPTRRAVVLIDPPYEEKADYKRVVSAVEEGLKRFGSGTYAIWYPLLSRPESRQLPERLKKLAPDWLQVELQVQAPRSDGFGMYGSGMFVLNPPWTLEATLREVMPCLQQRLGLDTGSSFHLQAESR